MKKHIIIVLSVCVVILLIWCIYLNTITVSTTTEDIYSSKVDYYQQYISTGNPVILGEIKDAKAAAKAANDIWKKRYGIRIPIKEKPYNVAYDEQNKVWYVTGTLRFSHLFDSLGISVKGGTAFLVIQEENGQILAVGHEE